MRLFLTICLFLFVSPAVAQQGKACRGKTTYDLGDGAYACVIKIEAGSVTMVKRTSRGGLATRRSKIFSQVNAVVDANFFGKNDYDYQVMESRAKAICRAVQGQIKTEFGDTKFAKTIVKMNWPDDPQRRGLVNQNTGKEVGGYIVYEARVHPRCGGARVA